MPESIQASVVETDRLAESLSRPAGEPIRLLFWSWTSTILAVVHLCAALLVLLLVSNLQGQAPSATNRFLTEAPLKWQEYRQRSVSLQGKKKGRAKITHKDLVTSDAVWEDEIKQTTTAGVIIRSYTDKEIVEDKTRNIQFDQVLGKNAKYAFRLTRARSRPDWALDKISMHPETSFNEYKLPMADDIFQSISPHFMLVMTTLSHAVKNKELVVKRETAIQRDNRQLVRVEFDYCAIESNPERETHPGWLIVDPERYWCLLEMEIHARSKDGSGGIIRVRNEVGAGSRQLPIIQRNETKLQGTDADGHKIGAREFVHEFDLRESTPPPEHAFTLSAFDLPEPHGIVWHTSANHHLWFLAAGIGILILSVGLRRRVSRIWTT
ncbi:MAG: hypothetical protein FJ271_15365 [Planctomycetes bacterium]|nr:hypothetical protein [Planctomycetota bacterium]